MHTPPTVLIDMMSNVPSHLNFPFRTDRGTGDVQGKYKTRKEEAGPTVIASPVARFELKLLEEPKSIDGGFRRRFWSWKDWSILHVASMAKS